MTFIYPYGGITMTTLVNDNGDRIEFEYDEDHDVTPWDTYDSDGVNTGSGQVGGNAEDSLTKEYEDKGYHSPSHS